MTPPPLNPCTRCNGSGTEPRKPDGAEVTAYMRSAGWSTKDRAVTAPGSQMPVPPEAVTTAHEDLTAWMFQWEWMSPLSAAQVRDVCRAVVDRVLEVAAPVLRDHWLSGGALHELVFTDREARPAKWRTRCGRTDVPLERTTSPDPAGYYQVDCPACLRVAELEARLAEVRRIAESLGDRSKPADYLPPFDPNQPASERPLTDRRLMEPLKAMLLDVLDRP